MSTTADLPSTQQAYHLTNPGPSNTFVLVDDAPLPPHDPLPADHVLVRNTHVGINFIDHYFRSGLYPLPSYPAILGNEGEGHVVASTSPNFRPGDRVAYFHTQSYAQYTAVPTRVTYKLPEGVPAGHGAAIILQGLTALTLVRDAYAVQRGDWVVVHAAAGGVGLLLVQLVSRVLGAHVIATASTAEKLELARHHGADVLVNYTTEDWVQAVQAVPQVAELGGVHAVFDGVGAATFDGDLVVLRRKGSLVSFGNASGAVPPVVLSRLGEKNVKLLRPRLHGYVATQEEFDGYSRELFDLVSQGKVEVKIHDVYPWQDLPRAQEELKGRGTVGKLIVKVD